MNLPNPAARTDGIRIFRPALAGAALLVLAAAAGLGQGAGATGLAVRVNPETRIAPSSAVVMFHLAKAGDIVTGAPITVTGWMRALPNLQIRMTADVLQLTGPSGTAPSSAIRWTGATLRTGGGGLTASCANGAFGDGLPQLLVSGWMLSGIVSCNVTFSLVSEADWQTGAYRAEIGLALSAQ